MSTFDAEILNDFLTESSELLERMEGDLVALESAPADPGLINQVFRALHTIKGSASFLALTALVRVSHVAEGALNAARSGQAVIDRTAMDLLLQATDVIKLHMGQLRSGTPLTEPDPRLVASLERIAEGRAGGGSRRATDTTDSAEADPGSNGPGESELVLPPSKADLLDFLVSDVEATLVQVGASLNEGGGSALAETCDALARAVEFFECDALARSALCLSRVGSGLGTLDSDSRAQVLPCARALLDLLGRQVEGLKRRRLINLPAEPLVARIDALLSGEPPPEGTHVEATAGTDALLAADAPGPVGRTTPAAPATDAGVQTREGAPAAGARGAGPSATAEQTIRVDVSRLEQLMNLVGELVLQKNRVAALSRKVGHAGAGLDDALVEAMGLAAGSLDRVTSDIQLAVMRARMQPLEKLFGRYPRLIRDLAGKTGKQIGLVIEGGDTEVDKSVIDELADPLVHLLRNSADHGLESPDERRAAGKSAAGQIRLTAAQHADHVRIEVIDDGRGLNRARIQAKAVERGLVAEAHAAQLSDPEVFQFIFLPGFSTVDKVSDLSGRGVGMDVVLTNIQKIKGDITLASTPGQGTTIAITIPLTVAILPAMMVDVAGEIYAIPLANVTEIVKPDPEQLLSIGQKPVMRLRDGVLPLADGMSLFDVPPERRGKCPFAVILASHQNRVGLMVSRLIGQQEIVVKPLDSTADRSKAEKGPISGATVRDDGGVSLIVDVAELLRRAQSDLPRLAG